jgi:RNA polymerase sigma factor for flagellar operon FliA
MLADTAGAWLVPLENVDPDGADMADAANPLADIEENALQNDLAEVIRTLPEREQLVMSLYYQDELNLREIGEVIGVGESRVCQIHSQAVARIRARLERGWINPGSQG